MTVLLPSDRHIPSFDWDVVLSHRELEWSDQGRFSLTGLMID